MTRWERLRTAGFTIVELVIVITVITILAVIIAVSYRGVREDAVEVKVQSELSNVQDLLASYAFNHSGQYPATLSEVGVTNGDVTYQYTSTPTPPYKYAVTASDGIAGSKIFYVTSEGTAVRPGTAPGHNLAPWAEPDAASMPLRTASGITIDTTTYRSAPASVRIAPNNTSKRFKIDPVPVEAGKTITVSLWMKTDSDWNGISGNSKIRFGNGSGNALIKACPYNGVKTTWTKVDCSWVATSDIPTVTISVGNDGSTGNIWLDDISVSIE